MRYTLALLMKEIEFLKSEEEAIQDKINKFDFNTISEYEFFKDKKEEIRMLIEVLQTDLIIIYNFNQDKEFKHHLKKWKDEN
jgi:predicted metallo-beta-lactamase superfamily hydrolase